MVFGGFRGSPESENTSRFNESVNRGIYISFTKEIFILIEEVEFMILLTNESISYQLSLRKKVSSTGLEKKC